MPTRPHDEHTGQPLVLLGVPSDVNSSWLRGAAGAPGAIRAALACESAHLWTENGVDLGDARLLHDAGDVEDADDFEEVERVAAGWVARGARLLTLGGDHAVTHPLLRAHRERFPALTVLHLDAHPDLYADFAGNPRSHASPFARALEDGLITRLVQVGVRTLNPHLCEQVARWGVEVIEMRDWERTAQLELEGPVYLSFDVDVLDPAFAPGVSHQEPGGASTRQVLDLLHALDADVVGADVVELNPARDPQGITAMTAARIAREIGGKMLERHAR